MVAVVDSRNGAAGPEMPDVDAAKAIAETLPASASRTNVRRPFDPDEYELQRTPAQRSSNRTLLRRKSLKEDYK
jgi:hypothetical protein